jgi:hypothetical protein
VSTEQEDRARLIAEARETAEAIRRGYAIDKFVEPARIDAVCNALETASRHPVEETEWAARRKDDGEITEWRYETARGADHDIDNFAKPDDWEVVERKVRPWLPVTPVEVKP